MTFLFRNIAVCILFMLLAYFPGILFSLDIKYCYIADQTKHEVNQKLLKAVLDKELDKLDSNMNLIDQANYLSSIITEIGTHFITQGFVVDAYETPNSDQNSVIAFNCFPLWEGKKHKKGKIPLTFFVYIWPSEALALRYHSTSSLNCHYCTIIHSHPIPCSFTVLQGTLCQKNYVCIGSDSMVKLVRLIDEEMFKEGGGDIDDLTNNSIHKLFNKDYDSKVCLSLHAYGLSSAEEVMACFRDTFSQCSYEHEFSKDSLN